MNDDSENFSLEPRKAIFQLFISGGAENFDHNHRRLSSLLASRLGTDSFELQVFDVWKDPEMAVKNRILATPTLIKVSPYPKARIIGQVWEPNALSSLFGSSV